MSRTVVITGFGAFTPLGTDAPSTWEAMLAGKSGVHTLAQPWAADLPVTFAAEAAGDPVERLDRVAARRLDRSSQLALAAGLEAWSDAGLGLGEDNTVDPYRLLVSVGSVDLS